MVTNPSPISPQTALSVRTDDMSRMKIYVQIDVVSHVSMRRFGRCSFRKEKVNTQIAYASCAAAAAAAAGAAATATTAATATAAAAAAATTLAELATLESNAFSRKTLVKNVRTFW